MDKEITVAGKKVVFRTRLNWRDMWETMMTMNKAQENLTPEIAARQVSLMVESWEFPGDPADPETWDQDFGFEFMRIFQASTEFFQERQESLGNAAGPSSEAST